jgi:hypothetical protein
MIWQALLKTKIYDPAGNRNPDFESDISRISEHAVSQLVQALYHKPEGREFNFGWFYWNFSLP